MSWLVSAKQYIPAVIGEPWGGGYFAGYISHTADGNPTHALIVAPKATGATGTGYPVSTDLIWETAPVEITGATSSFDGAANTAALVTAGKYPAAQFCTNLSIGGYGDWYLPARYELDVAYFNLKPVASNNSTSWGANIYSVPQRNINYTLTYPEKTTVNTFTTSAEAFAALQWSSTEVDGGRAWVFAFNNGSQIAVAKSLSYTVRAFRRITL